jgi:hypothetical protein
MEDIYLHSFIDIKSWDSARWRATAFLHDASGLNPPCVGIVFENIAAGKQIFADWLARLGDVDQYEELRVSIVEGEILGLGAGYSVHISSNPLHSVKRVQAAGAQLKIGTSVTVSRVHRMITAPGSPHLAKFKGEFEKHKQYDLVAVSPEVTPEFQFAIRKTEIFLRLASDIGADDVDAVVFPEHYFDDDCIVH